MVSRYFVQVFLNYSGVIYTLGTILVVLIINAYFTCPQVFGAESCQVPILFGYFVVFQVAINFVLFHYNAKYNRVTSILPDATRMVHKKPNIQTPPTFYSNLQYSNSSNNSHTNSSSMPQQKVDNADFTKYCYTCQMVVPQRCHHCPLCNYCILKKDHHCFLTGACVGFGNQRYFVVFLFWASVGAAFGTFFAFQYLQRFYQPFLPFGWVDYIFPLAAKKWLFYQHCSVIQLGIVLVFTLGASGAGVAFAFFVSQWYFILKGRTMFEHTHSTEVAYDNLSMSHRVASIFGPFWAVNFLFPSPYKNKMDESFKKIIYDYYVKEL